MNIFAKAWNWFYTITTPTKVVPQIPVRRLFSNATLPTKAYPGDAGWDIYAQENVNLLPGGRKWVSTGIAVGIPSGYFGKISDRSGVSGKFGLHCMAGVVDSQFRGEVKVLLVNLSRIEVNISIKDKICQMLILPVPEFEVVEVEHLDDTDRGDKGFGSSGNSVKSGS